MNRKIILAGGTGFIGRYLQKRYEALGYNVYLVSRKKGHIRWDDQKGLTDALESADLLVNLAGKSVNCRYTKKNKALILSSRVDTTHQLGEAILRCKEPPVLWINSSTATIYRHAEDRPMSEQGGDIGSGFSTEVGIAWEDAFFSFRLKATRQVALRIAIVLGKDGGAFIPYKRMAKCGLGGPQGSGQQMFSWLHIADVFHIIRFLEQHPLDGVFNVSSPMPIKNKRFMRSLRKHAGIPVGLPLPVPLLKLGGLLIGTDPELLIKSRWVIPERLEQAGFQFEFPEIEGALTDLMGS